MKEKKTEQIIHKAFNGWSVLNNYEFHRLGRIWVVWQDLVRLNTIFKGSQVITFSVCAMKMKNNYFVLSFMHQILKRKGGNYGMTSEVTIIHQVSEIKSG